MATKDSTSTIAIITSIIALIGAVITGVITFFNNNRGQDIEMVRIALSILSGENKDTSIYGRRYALKMLEEYAVDIDDKDFEEWAQTGTIPDISWLASWSKSKDPDSTNLTGGSKSADITEYQWFQNSDGSFRFEEKRAKPVEKQ